jgi:hypothetical protein
MKEMADEIADLVLEFGGGMSGEHGDGLARSHLNERLFGPQLYKAFRDVKGAFDPEHRMNPGKIVLAPPMTENLRYGAEYQTITINTHYDFTREGGFATAVELCNGAGVCRKQNEGTMCPSYMVTLEDKHSTRGRANYMREILSGKIPAHEFTGKQLHDVLDLCLECKGCKAECPSNVDMAKLKYEFLAHYNTANGVPLRSRMFAQIHSFSRMASVWPSLATRVYAALSTASSASIPGASFRFLRHRPLRNGSPSVPNPKSEIRNPKSPAVWFSSTTPLSITTIRTSERPPQSCLRLRATVLRAADDLEGIGRPGA